MFWVHNDIQSRLERTTSSRSYLLIWMYFSHSRMFKTWKFSYINTFWKIQTNYFFFSFQVSSYFHHDNNTTCFVSTVNSILSNDAFILVANWQNKVKLIDLKIIRIILKMLSKNNGFQLMTKTISGLLIYVYNSL